MSMATDRVDLITQSLQVDAFVDPLATIVGHNSSQLYLRSS